MKRTVGEYKNESLFSNIRRSILLDLEGSLQSSCRTFKEIFGRPTSWSVGLIVECHGEDFLVPRPFHHPVFDCLWCTKWKGKAVNDVKSLQRGDIFCMCSVFWAKSGMLFASKTSSAWGRNYKIRPLARFFNRGRPPPPPSPLCLPGRHWCHSHDKVDHFAYWWEGLGTRVGWGVKTRYVASIDWS